jgi:hypothetical protein
MKTAVEAIFAGKDRLYNRRFLQMCSHFLVEPVACTPASGWEKGQVENQVGLVRERFFTPRLRVKSYEELNSWLLEQAITYAKAHRHPELKDRTVWQVFEAERASLVPYSGRFDGFHAVPASVSRTCLVRFDNNHRKKSRYLYVFAPSMLSVFPSSQMPWRSQPIVRPAPPSWRGCCMSPLLRSTSCSG